MVGKKNKASVRLDGLLFPFLFKQGERIRLSAADWLETHDASSLHKLRVATRRARTAAKVLRHTKHIDYIKDLEQNLRWLAKSTSDARDYDVLLDDVKSYLNHLPLSKNHPGDAFVGYLTQCQETAYGQVIKALSDPTYKRLENTIQRAKSHSLSQNEEAWLAFRFLKKHYKTLRKDARAITPACQDGDIHSLRKKGKTLRYVLELFAPYFPEQDLSDYIGQMKAKQDYLGAFQDAVTQNTVLSQCLTHLRNDVEKAEDTSLLLIGSLWGKRLDKSVKLREKIVKKAAKFPFGKNHKRFKAILSHYEPAVAKDLQSAS